MGPSQGKSLCNHCLSQGEEPPAAHQHGRCWWRPAALLSSVRKPHLHRDEPGGSWKGDACALAFVRNNFLLLLLQLQHLLLFSTLGIFELQHFFFSLCLSSLSEFHFVSCNRLTEKDFCLCSLDKGIFEREHNSVGLRVAWLTLSLFLILVTKVGVSLSVQTKELIRHCT